MKHCLLIVLAILSLCAVTLDAQNTADIATVPFRVSSVGSGFAYDGVFEGEFRILPERIELTVNRATIYLRDIGSYKGQRRLASIKAGLATKISKGEHTWKIVRESNEVKIERLLMPGDEFTIENLKFTIPKEKSIKLSKHWLVFSIESYVFVVDIERSKQPGYSYAHSEHTIFSKL